MGKLGNKKIVFIVVIIALLLIGFILVKDITHMVKKEALLPPPLTKRQVDSLASAWQKHEDDSVKADSIEVLKEQRAFEKWENTTRAGHIYKKHPDWDTADCELVAKNKIWIGMTYEMLLIERGTPDHLTTSNYGDGNTYQACWLSYSASCVYFGEDHVITKWN